MVTPIPVNLKAYDPSWPDLATWLITQLQAASPLLTIIHHIGSTSIPGLAAKPIIDLLPVVADLNRLDIQRSCIESIGYSWHGEFGITGRRYCKLDDTDGNRIAQLHIFETGSPHINRHLAFRDYLIAHPEIARAYEAEKRRARRLHPNSSHDYSAEKSAWIKTVQDQALDWAQR
jgi:GrpB-like predicted nucleotidyltransferase (UPF0157 family)